MQRPSAASRIRHAPLAAIVLLATTLGPVTLTAAPTPASPTKARIMRVDGDPVEGTFVRADAKEVMLEGLASPVPIAAVREIRFAADAPPRPLPEGSVGLRVVLRGGDVLRGSLESADAEELTIKPPDLDALKLPFDSIRQVETEAPDRSPCDEPSRGRPARKGTDVAYARSGDAFAGTLAEANLKGVVLESNGVKRTLAWSELVVLHLDGVDPAPATDVLSEIETVGGSTLLGADATGDASRWTLTLRSGAKVAVAKDAIVVVRRSGGSFTRVETLAFTEVWTTLPGYEDTSAETAKWWAYRVDRRREGCPLRIAGTTYRHGIAVHAKSVITVPLGKAYRSFSTTFGIDDQAIVEAEGRPSIGDVTARVLVDGKEAWSSKGSVKGREPARSIGPIDVTGAATLVLEVGLGDDQHRNDLATWADPILVKAP